MRTTWIKLLVDNQHLFNLSEIAKIAGVKRTTLHDILYNEDRWEKEDYRIEEVFKHLRDSMVETSKKKYSGK